MTLTEAIAACRKPRSQVAIEAGISRSTLYLVEAGGSNHTVETLTAIARACRVAASDIWPELGRANADQ